MSDSVLGLGIVGLGFMGRRYTRFLRGIEGVRLAGVYDVDGDLARDVVAECGGTVYIDVDSLAAADLAGVIVCTPEDRHLEPALAALRLSLAMEHSAETGTVVDLTTFFGCSQDDFAGMSADAHPTSGTERS